MVYNRGSATHLLEAFLEEDSSTCNHTLRHNDHTEQGPLPSCHTFHRAVGRKVPKVGLSGWPIEGIARGNLKPTRDKASQIAWPCSLPRAKLPSRDDCIFCSYSKPFNGPKNGNNDVSNV